MEVIGFTLLIVLIAILVAFVIAAIFVYVLKKRIYNFLGIKPDSKSEKEERNGNNSSTRKTNGKGKIFGEDEGSYVDFEEVKDE